MTKDLSKSFISLLLRNFNNMTRLECIFDNVYDNFHFIKGNLQNDSLFIVFSSRDQRTIKFFTFFKTFQKLDVDTLFIKSSQNTWYHSGITDDKKENLADVFTEIIKQVLLYAKTKKINKIYVVGSSMGGYAALLFGHLVNTLFIDNNIYLEIISISPETVLFLPNSRSIEHENFNDIVPPQFIDITLLKYYANRITIYFGEFDLVDVYSALKFKSFNKTKHVKLYSITDGSHLIPQLLNDRYCNGITEFFYNIFFFNIYEPIYSGNIAKCLTYKDVAPLIYDKNIFDCVEKLKDCIRKYPSFGFIYNRLGYFYEKNNNFSLAKHYYDISLLLNKGYQNTISHINYILAEEKRKK